MKKFTDEQKLLMIQRNATMPRQIRRAFWKRLRETDGITWKEYLELEAPEEK